MHISEFGVLKMGFSLVFWRSSCDELLGTVRYLWLRGGRGFSTNSGIWKICPSLKVGILKITPRLCDSFKIPPPPSPTLRTRHAYNCKIAYNMCSGCVPINQNQVQGHLWSYSMEALSKESKFAAPVLTCAQRRSDSREKCSLQGLNQFCCLRMAIYVRTTIL